MRYSEIFLHIITDEVIGHPEQETAGLYKVVESPAEGDLR
jgi:hypothetical protein